jgi:predicted peptidase
MGIKKIRSAAVDCLLLIAIIGLSVVLAWPTIEAWQNRPRPGVQASQQYEFREDRDANAILSRIDYLLYLPPNYAKDHQWPLVVFLHGAGERGQDLSLVRRCGLPKMAGDGKNFEFILVSPQCPADWHWSQEVVLTLTEHISNTFSVDRNRVYLTGYSMGGYGTWQTACSDPDRFAAIAPVAGAGDVEQAKQLTKLPIWAFHGAMDNIVPLSASQTMVDAVRKCGGHVEFTVYPWQGHGICDITYQDEKFLAWLLAQHRSTH